MVLIILQNKDRKFAMEDYQLLTIIVITIQLIHMGTRTICQGVDKIKTNHLIYIFIRIQFAAMTF